MVVQMLKKVFKTKKTSAEVLSQELGDLLFDLNSDEELLALKTAGLTENLDVILACGYLFSYRLVIIINDIRMSSKLLDEIYYNFFLLICNKKLKESEVGVDKLQNKVEGLVVNYQKNFATKRNVDMKKVIEILCTDLDREIDLNLKSALASFLLKNITIIQDFLVARSLYLRSRY